MTRKPQTGKNFMYMKSSLGLVPDWVAEGAAEKWENEKRVVYTPHEQKDIKIFF